MSHDQVIEFKQAYHRCSLWMLLGKKPPQNSKKVFFPLVPGWSLSLSVSESLLHGASASLVQGKELK